MARHTRALVHANCHVHRVGAAFIVAMALALGGAGLGADQPPVAGRNINVTGGPVTWEGTPFQSRLITGDPFGQRKDEISCAVDNRNPLVIMCAFNDYTPVSVAGLLGDGRTGDAWIGRAWSKDGGLTWTNDLLPGYPQDTSGAGLGSPLHGFAAASDPVVRSGGPFGGRFYVAGIAFNREDIHTVNGAETESRTGVFFVQAYINNNNIENDPRPVKPDPTVNGGQPVILATGVDGQFHDKPWIAVGSDGAVHAVVATFLAGNSTIWYYVSRDRGNTYSKVKLSDDGQRISNGAIVTVHPWTFPQWVDVAWRRRASPGQSDAIAFVRSTDGGSSFSSPMVIPLPALQRADGTLVSRPFDQGTGQYFFRNISNPAIATDDQRRVYLAWAERVQGIDSSGRTTRDSQIKLTVGIPQGGDDGGNTVVWATPAAIDTLITPLAVTTRGHQLRPSLSFAFGKLMLTYMHTRDDDMVSVFTRKDVPDPGRPGGNIVTYVETQEPRGDLAASPPHPEKVFNDFIIDLAPAPTVPPIADVVPNFSNNPPLLRRHTEDVMALMGTPAPPFSNALPTFVKTKVSRYPLAFRNGRLQQGQFNVLTRALHCGGNCAFAGDYDDVAAQPSVPDIFGIGFLPNTFRSNAPRFYASWTDNRDLMPLGLPTTFSRVGPACTDPTATGTRKQNPYIAPVGNGLYLYSFGNQKPLNTAFSRAFTVLFQNAVNATKHYRATIANQPFQGSASWLQFSPLATIDLSIPPFTTAARVVYAKSLDTTAPIKVNVVEITQPGGPPVAGGLQSSIILNPDRFTPAFASPIPDPNVDPTNPLGAEIYIPDVTSPDPTSANVYVTPDPTSLPPLSPDPTSPDPTSPDPTSVPVSFPDPTSPDPTSPDPTSVPSISPDPTSPDVTSISPTDALTDTVYTFTNKSNVAASFSIKTFSTTQLCAGCKLQLIVTRPSLSPTQRGCDPKNQDTSVLIASIPSPPLIGDPNQLTFDPRDSSPKNVTIAAPPGGKFSVIYRLFDPNAANNITFTDAFGRKHSINPTFNPAGDVVPVTVPQSLSSNIPIPPGCPPTCPTPTPVVPLSITTGALFDGVAGRPYNGELGQQMTAQGGVGSDSWAAVGMPSGMVISPTGRISGIPSVAGTYQVTFTVTDSATPPHMASRTLSLRIAAPLLITTVALPDGVNGVSYSQQLTASGGIAPLAWTVSGTLPPGVSLSLAGLLSGTPKVSGDFPITVTVRDSANPQQSAVKNLLLHIAQAVFVSTFNGNQIVRVNPTSGAVTVLYTGPVTFLPEGIVLGPDGKLYVCNSLGNQILRMDRDGSNATVIYDQATAVVPNNPAGPEGPSFSGGDLYFNTRGPTPASTGVWKIAGATTPTPAAPVNILPASALGNSTFGEGTAFAPNGDLLVVSRSLGQVFRSSPPFSTATPVITGLANPFGVAVNTAGDIFVADNNSPITEPTIRKVLRFNSTGALIGDFATFVSPDGPSFLQFDAAGDLYVVTVQSGDASIAKVWRIDASGVKTLLTATPLGFGAGVTVPSGPLP